MPEQGKRALARQSRELVKQSRELCAASRDRIERSKRLSEDIGERTSRADDARRKADRSKMTRCV